MFTPHAEWTGPRGPEMTMTPEQIVTFIKILNQREILSFSGEDPVVLDLGAGAIVEIVADGSQFWYLNGQQHRADGPAAIRADGSQSWWLNGKLHREDGPAVIDANGSQFWDLDGQSHRADGQAEIRADGSQRWFLNGKEMTQKEHDRRTAAMLR